jgi:hypothetical protein
MPNCLQCHFGPNSQLRSITKYAAEQSLSSPQTVQSRTTKSAMETGVKIPCYSRQYVGADLDDWQPLIDWGLTTTSQAMCSFLRLPLGCLPIVKERYRLEKTLRPRQEFGRVFGRNRMIYHRPTVGSYQL